MLNLKIMPNYFHSQRVDMSVLTEHTVADTITKEGLVARLIVFPCLHASLPIKCSFQLAKNGDLNKESPVCMEKREAIASAHHRGLDFNSNRANVIASRSSSSILVSRCCPT